MQLKKTMPILFITLSLSMFYTKILRGQSPTDSLVFRTAKWEIQDLCEGVKWYHLHFNEKQIFNSNQNIHFLKFKNKNRKLNIKFADLEDDTLRLTSALAKQNKALAAVNGSFFNIKNGWAVDLIKIDGKVLDTTELKEAKRSFHQKSAVVIHKNKLRILSATKSRKLSGLRGDTTDMLWDRHLKEENVMVTGPLLIFDGQVQPLAKNATIDNRHPRTCACITPENDVILLTVDGRTAESEGVSLHELSFIMQTLNCKDAINLDGGGSTTMYIEGKGVVNMPCDNKKFDHEGERKVSNIIFIRPTKSK
jgi:exopolysaccharide biosynthesis protein